MQASPFANLLDGVTPETLSHRALSWAPSPKSWEPSPNGGGIRVAVEGKTDYFRDPSGSLVIGNAAYLYSQVSGDFVVRTHVQPTFSATYDAGALMIWHNESHWAKLCFEKTDFGTTALVSVVTNDYSDDANGPNVTAASVCLQAARVADTIVLHYSLNGTEWIMLRVFRFPYSTSLRVGLVAQCPTGTGTTIDFKYLSVEKRTLANLRAGN